MNIIYITSLLGPFGPIFYFNCEHRKRKQKKFADFNKRLDENLILMGTNIQKFDH